MRVDYQRHPHGLEGSTRQLRPVLRSRRGQLTPINMGKVHTAFFDYSTIGQYARTSATALGALPIVLMEATTAGFRFKCREIAVLKIQYIDFDVVLILGFGVAVCPAGHG